LAAQIEDFKFNGDIPYELDGDIRHNRISEGEREEDRRRRKQESFEMALTLTILAIFSLFVFASCFIILCRK
jgi:hypothetical protein